MSLAFNDPTNYSGIIQGCEDYCNLGTGGISGNSELLAKFTRHANVTMSKIWHWIFQAYGGWQYDDGNNINLPIATQNLTAGTSAYALPTDALTVRAVEFIDSNGNWKRAMPITDEALREVETSSVAFTRSGDPVYYELLGTTIKLSPCPSTTQSSGLKVFFDRGSVAFEATDTTKQPGFASEFHNAVTVGASLEWMKPNKSTQGVFVNLTNDWRQYEQDIKDFYVMRYRQNNPVRIRSRLSRVSFR